MRLPGVGRKTAERLIIEMRDRVRHPGLAGGDAGSGRPAMPADSRTEALDALLALGYKAPEARRMLDRVPDEGQTTEDLLRVILRGAVRS
jgi:Holliday junction DNA helicase RuvA